MRQPHSSLVIWMQLKHCQDPADSMWSKSMRQRYALGTRSYQASQDASRKKRICAGYAPATFLARHLDPARIPPDSMWSKGMRQGYALGTRPHWPSQTVSRKNRICARYAPATLLARHLDPTGTRPVSCWNQSGARVCVRGMRLSSHALNLAKVPLDKKQICAELMRQGKCQGMH